MVEKPKGNGPRTLGSYAGRDFGLRFISDRDARTAGANRAAGCSHFGSRSDCGTGSQSHVSPRAYGCANRGACDDGQAHGYD